MAFGQTLMSSRNLLFTVPRNPHTNIISLSPTPQYSSFSLTKRPRSFRTLKCSVDYRDQNYNLQVTYPKPPEIPWSKDLCNTVHLIGNVGAAVDMKHLPSGKVLAWTRLAVKKSSTDTTWINLTFWDELANTAYQHVEKGQQIYVCGRLVSDTVESDDGKQQTYYKRSPKYPDFKHKDTGEALWIEGRNNPHWVKSQLEILDSRMSYFEDEDERMHASITGDNLTPF
ncbi:Primosome PriB/single-strand DNA-binding, putative isoform 3 [Theobroma cacao]|uniref:Primosome PriB/single-strand DNA-binding, putative isoform 3 n=1 Tax=Theobroma cacao TaxID=3641 RepID=A0A061DP30_THECC|nr:Primosome PriB/single-strand DNA-binding, putative isoform 3 [Theobroma cacao]